MDLKLILHLVFYTDRNLYVQGRLSLRDLSSGSGHDVDLEEQLSGVKLLWTRMQWAQGPTVLHTGACMDAGLLRHSVRL